MVGGTKEWLRQLAHLIPGDCTPQRIAALHQMERALLKKVVPGLMQPCTVRPVAALLKGFPTPDELASAIQAAAPAALEAEANGTAAPAADGQEPKSERSLMAWCWVNWLGERLAGATAVKRAHLYSMAKAYVPQEDYEWIMRAHFPGEYRQHLADLAQTSEDRMMAQQHYVSVPAMRVTDRTPRSAPRERQMAAAVADMAPASREEMERTLAALKQGIAEKDPWTMQNRSYVDGRVKQLEKKLAELAQ